MSVVLCIDMRAPARRVDTDLQHGGPVRARVAVNVNAARNARGEGIYPRDRELFGHELISKGSRDIDHNGNKCICQECNV